MSSRADGRPTGGIVSLPVLIHSPGSVSRFSYNGDDYLRGEQDPSSLLEVKTHWEADPVGKGRSTESFDPKPLASVFKEPLSDGLLGRDTADANLQEFRLMVDNIFSRTRYNT